VSETDRTTGRRIAAFFLSFFVLAGGHVLLGRWRRGLAFVAAIVLLFVALPWIRSITMFGWAALYLLMPIDTLFIRARPRPAWPKLIAAWVALLGFALGFSFLIRTQWAEGFRVPSSNMAPTLLPGDHFVVAKTRRNPAPGDVIVFRYPKDPELDYVKRVIGVAGDRIQMKNGTLIINGTEVKVTESGPCAYQEINFDTEAWETINTTCAEETLGKTSYVVTRQPEQFRDFPEDGTAPFVVPKDTVFVLGDNRENSADSRMWGPVPLDHIKGTALFITLSRGQGIRWRRTGNNIR
jgi:signal peptidase I